MNRQSDFVAEMIEIFEGFLEYKGIVLENDEKEGDEDEANIYGSDYGYLQTEIEDLLDRKKDKKEMTKVVIILDKE